MTRGRQQKPRQEPPAKYVVLRLSYFDRRNKPVEILVGSGLLWGIAGYSTLVGILIRVFLK
jgi:hypothetical protein